MRQFIVLRRWLRRIHLDLERVGSLIMNVGLPLLVGLGLGAFSVIMMGFSTKWVVALMLALIAPSVVLLIGDIKKLTLFAIVINMPLGFDIAIQNHPNNQGGPSGYTISLLTFALLAGYAWWIVEYPRRKVYFFKSMSIPLVVFFLLAIISTFQSVSVTLSFFSLFLFLEMLLMYFYIVNHVKTWADFRFVLNVWVACLAFEGIFMILQYFTGFNFSFGAMGSSSYYEAGGGDVLRVGGTFSGPNDAAIWLTPTLAVALGIYLMYNEQRQFRTDWILLSFLLGVVGLVLSFSRSGWLALGVAMLILGSLAIVRGVAQDRLVVMLIVAMFAIGLFFPLIVRRFSASEESVSIRQLEQKHGWNVIQDQPIKGVGVNNFDQRMFAYLPIELMGEFREYIYVVHNHYLLVWAEMGFFGLLAFVGCLLAAIGQVVQWLNFRSQKTTFILSASLLAALAGNMLHMNSDVFAWPMTVQLLWFLFSLMTAVAHLETSPAA